MINSEKETPKLSEYEQTRARNIERHNARLRFLGLISLDEERRSNDNAWGRDCTKNRGGRNPQSPLNKKRDSPSTGKIPREGSRKSRRLMKLPANAEGGNSDDENLTTLGETDEDKKEKIQREREALLIECREARQRAALEVARAGAELAGKENPTATYEHCLMRVRSMSKKGLANRVRAIERSAGKHCVVKMAIFKSCLQDEGLWDLAELASGALERLKGLLPPPSQHGD